MDPGVGLAKLVNEFARLQPKSEVKEHLIKQWAFSMLQLSEFSYTWVDVYLWKYMYNLVLMWCLNNGVCNWKQE